MGSAAWESYRQTLVAPPSLWDAAKSDDVAELGRLLDAGAAIDAKDARGYSPLMLATYAGSARAFDYLLGRGADPNSTDAAGNSVLMGAAFKGHIDLARKLIAAGADPKAQNGAGMDALGFAKTFGRADVAALLEGGSS